MKKVMLFLLCVAVLATWGASALADESYQKLYPLLPDLSGWEGFPPEGTSVSANNETMITVTRNYTKGDAAFSVNLMAGSAAAGAVQGYENVTMETDDVRVFSGQRKGFDVLDTWQKQEKTGSLLVLLGGKGVNRLAVFEYSGVTYEEGVGLAESFDWKALDAGLASVSP